MEICFSKYPPEHQETMVKLEEEAIVCAFKKVEWTIAWRELRGRVRQLSHAPTAKG